MTSLITIFTNNLLPILLVATIGYILQRSLKLDPRPISQVVFNVFTPALVFSVLVSTNIEADDIGRMVSFTVVIMAIIGIISLLLSRVMKLHGSIVSAFILSTTFANAGNYGLSVNQFAYGEEALAWASLFYVTNSLLINSAGVYIASVGKLSPKVAFLGLLKVPVVYAIPLALLVRSANIDLPLAIWRPIELLGAAAVPAMLIILGMQIGRSGPPRKVGLLSLTVFLRLILSPLIALLIAPIWGLAGLSLKAGVIEAAMPTAVLVSIIAIEYDAYPEFVTGAILTTTLISPLTITPLLAFLS
ncbi:MAG: hypothetical protein GTO18_01455 [Anaerolineales bacterium]|nr:hypothetical protein [Anaerolineales bacterium]